MCETFREQRAQRAIDQPAHQCFRFTRSPLATEEVAGNLAGSITLLLVVDRQRKEITPDHRILVTHNSGKHLGITHADNYSAALTGDFAGFHRDRLVTELKGFLDCAHGRLSSLGKVDLELLDSDSD